jgi:DNA-directed RNA polymerase specialized sigma24 family protein
MSANPGHIDALKLGDEQAWSLAFHDLWPLALRAAQHPELVLTLEEAQDAASEALVQLVDQIDRVQTYEAVKALAVTIAYRRAVSLARRKSAAKRQPKTPSGDLAEQDCDARETSDSMSSGLSDPEIRELVVLLKEALAALDEETRAPDARGDALRESRARLAKSPTRLEGAAGISERVGGVFAIKMI